MTAQVLNRFVVTDRVAVSLFTFVWNGVHRLSDWSYRRGKVSRHPTGSRQVGIRIFNRYCGVFREKARETIYLETRAARFAPVEYREDFSKGPVSA